jgi:hypothetical protein
MKEVCMGVGSKQQEEPEGSEREVAVAGALVEDVEAG